MISEGYVIGYCHGEDERYMNSPLYDATMAKLAGRQKAWGKAVEQAKAEFIERGITSLDDTTPGYLERINERYHRLIPLS